MIGRSTQKQDGGRAAPIASAAATILPILQTRKIGDTLDGLILAIAQSASDLMASPYPTREDAPKWIRAEQILQDAREKMRDEIGI